MTEINKEAEDFGFDVDLTPEAYVQKQKKKANPSAFVETVVIAGEGDEDGLGIAALPGIEIDLQDIVPEFLHKPDEALKLTHTGRVAEFITNAYGGFSVPEPTDEDAYTPEELGLETSPSASFETPNITLEGVIREDTDWPNILTEGNKDIQMFVKSALADDASDLPEIPCGLPEVKFIKVRQREKIADLLYRKLQIEASPIIMLDSLKGPIDTERLPTSLPGGNLLKTIFDYVKESLIAHKTVERAIIRELKAVMDDPVKLSQLFEEKSAVWHDSDEQAFDYITDYLKD